MVSTYTHCSISTLLATKSTLLAMAATDEGVCGHLDAIEAELSRRVVPMVRKERMDVDEDGGMVRSVSHHCPNCEARCRPSNPYCPRCGQGIRKAA